MKDFDTRWQVGVAQARQRTAKIDQAAPGFATRVVAHAFEPRETPTEWLWERLGLRWLAGAAAFLVVCALIEWPHFRDPRPLNPGVENTVAQLVWSL